MRLRRFNLTRYGHFTDFIIDFGERPTSDFHIIFGENEAGKSTAFNGYLDLLFGIEERTKYSFLHDYNALRIGAALEIDNKIIELTRIKRRNGTLLDLNDQPLNEKVLTSALQGLSRNGYKMMFSLDDETIQLGGEEILASKGDFGRLLFAGTTGLADLSKRLESIKEQADSIFSERSRSSEIITLHHKLKQLKDERKNLDIQVSIYERLAETRQNAENTYLASRTKRDTLRQESQKLQILKNSIALHEELKQLECQLGAILHLPDVPLDWIAEVKDLQKTMAVAKGCQDEAQIDLDHIKSQIAFLPPRNSLIEKQKEIEAVSTYAIMDESARKCLPRLRRDLALIDDELETLRLRIEVEKDLKWGDLMVADDQIARLDALLQNKASLQQRLEFALQESSDAKICLAQAHEDEKKVGPPDEKVMELVALYERYNNDDIHIPLELAEKALAKASQKIERKIEKLAHFIGCRDDIKCRNFPTIEQAKRWQKKAKLLNEELAAKKMQRNETMEKRAVVYNGMKTLLSQLDKINDDAAAKIRKVRDTAWNAHLAILNKETAEAFEKLLGEDDHIRDERIAAIDRLTQYRMSEKELSEIEGRIHFISESINRIDGELQQLSEEVAPALLKAGLPAEFPIDELSAWLENMQVLLDLIDEEEALRLERDLLNTEYQRRHAKLTEALSGVFQKPSENHDLKELCQICKPFRDEAVQNRSRYDHAKKASSDAECQMQRREKVQKAIANELEQWECLWKGSLETCWFKQRNEDQIRALLAPLRLIVGFVSRQKSLAQELSVQEMHAKNFRDGVCKLTHSLGIDQQPDLTEQFSQLQSQLKVAHEVEILRKTAIDNSLLAALRLSKAEKEISRIEMRLKEMTAYFPSPLEILSFDKLAILLEQVKAKQELIKISSLKERALLSALAINSRSEADALLASTTLDEIETALIKMGDEYKEAELDFEKRIAERQDAIRAIEAIGGDARVARLNEEYQSILLEMESKANRALALHLGLMTADVALMAYRDRHRSDLLKQTAEVFSAITSGYYTHLATQPGQTGDVLVAVRSDGRSITVNEMSKGASFQMYLALRLAAYRGICRKEGPLPFIGDDIMETFDDSRVQASILQLNEIAKCGQVIYFTHHRHLCEIAKNICGDAVSIHQIPKAKNRIS